jgi:hypothetical protein
MVFVICTLGLTECYTSIMLGFQKVRIQVGPLTFRDKINKITLIAV